MKPTSRVNPLAERYALLVLAAVDEDFRKQSSLPDNLLHTLKLTKNHLVSCGNPDYHYGTKGLVYSFGSCAKYSKDEDGNSVGQYVNRPGAKDAAVQQLEEHLANSVGLAERAIDKQLMSASCTRRMNVTMLGILDAASTCGMDDIIGLQASGQRNVQEYVRG